MIQPMLSIVNISVPIAETIKAQRLKAIDMIKDALKHPKKYKY